MIASEVGDYSIISAIISSFDPFLTFLTLVYFAFGSINNPRSSQDFLSYVVGSVMSGILTNSKYQIEKAFQKNAYLLLMV